MKYTVEFEELVKRQCLQSGSPLPDWIENKPELEDGDDFYLEAFYQLGTERQLGFGEGPIPINAILSYSRHYGFGDAQEKDFVEIIMLLDAAYLKEQAAKQQKERAKK